MLTLAKTLKKILKFEMKIHDAQNYERKKCLLQISHNFFEQNLSVVISSFSFTFAESISVYKVLSHEIELLTCTIFYLCEK